MIYLVKYKKDLKEKMLNRIETITYYAELEAGDKKELVKKASKKYGFNNLIDIYLKIN
jgi:hypothetical protein